MRSAVRYYVALMSRRQTVLAPAFVFFALVGMVYASDAGPPLAAAAIPAAALVPVGAWLMWLCATCESRAFADVTLVDAGGHGRRLVARILAVGVFVAALTVVACIWANVANPHPYPTGVVLQIVVMNLSAGAAGIGLGAVLAPPLGATAGVATLAVAGVFVVTLIVRWLPPLGPMLHAFIGVRPPSGGRAALAFGQAALVGAALVALSHLFGRRAG